MTDADAARETDVLTALLSDHGDQGVRMVEEELKFRRRAHWVDVAERVLGRLLTAGLIVIIVLVSAALVGTGHSIEGGLLGLFNAAIAVASAWGRGKTGG